MECAAQPEFAGVEEDVRVPVAPAAGTIPSPITPTIAAELALDREVDPEGTSAVPADATLKPMDVTSMVAAVVVVSAGAVAAPLVPLASALTSTGAPVSTPRYDEIAPTELRVPPTLTV